MKYLGTYQKFKLCDTILPGVLLSADNSVGDVLDIKINLVNGEYTAYLINRFGQCIGQFDTDFSKRLEVLKNEGCTEKAILSFVAFTNPTDRDNSKTTNDANVSNNSDTDVDTYTNYWGSAAVICYQSSLESQFATFIKKLSSCIADDIRPKLDFGTAGIEQLVEHNGEWLPSEREKIDSIPKNMTYIKRSKRPLEKLIEQGRKKNAGCYVISWAFLILLAALIVLVLKSALGF